MHDYARADFIWVYLGYYPHPYSLRSYCPLPGRERDRVRVESYGTGVNAIATYSRSKQRKKLKERDLFR